MMQVVYGNRFLKSAKSLPGVQQQKLATLLSYLEQNPYHPLLRSKHLSGDLMGLLSFRISRDWRVIFQFIDARTVQLLHVAHRKEMYR